MSSVGETVMTIARYARQPLPLLSGAAMSTKHSPERPGHPPERPEHPPEKPGPQAGLNEVAAQLLDVASLSTKVERPRSAALPDVLHTVLASLGPLLHGSIYFIDREAGRIVYTTEHMLASLGYDGTMSIEHIDALVHPHDRHVTEEGKASFAKLPDDGVATIEFRMRGADGRWRWIEGRERVLTRTADGAVRLTVGIVRNVTERQKLRQALSLASKELLTVEEEERRRVARELHDSTTQLLTGARLMLAQLQSRAEGDAAEAIARVGRSIANAQQEIRTLSFLLHPPQLAENGLPATLEDLARGFARRSGLKVQVTVEGAPRVLGPAIELALFRVAQEGLLNAHKHAKATTVDVWLHYEPGSVSLDVEDNGVGLEAASDDLKGVPAGVGLSGMKARMGQLGGRLELSRSPKGGLRVVASAPTNASPWFGSSTTS
jgi:PAS domain S-box-containing protein